MERIRSGRVFVLYVTEVVGLVRAVRSGAHLPHHMLLQGTDIPDVGGVDQFMTPEELSAWTQRAGCTGRDGWSSRAALLVEPSVVKGVTQKSPKGSKYVTKGGVRPMSGVITCLG